MHAIRNKNIPIPKANRGAFRPDLPSLCAVATTATASNSAAAMDENSVLTARQLWMKTQFSQYDHLYYEYRRAGSAGDGEQALAAPCEEEREEECDPCRNRAGSRRDDGGEGHHRKSDVGYIVQKRAQKAIPDLAANQGQRQHANQIGNQTGHQNV